MVLLLVSIPAVLIVLYLIYSLLRERYIWNKGISRKTLTPWKCFDMDYQGYCGFNAYNESGEVGDSYWFSPFTNTGDQ